MDWSSMAQRMLGRDRVVKIAYSAYRHGVIIDSPMRSLESTRNWAVLEGEYIRSSSLELVAREIRERGVTGAVAELGVYRGEFARLINVAFPDRKLYLFDTFSGFDNDHVEEDASRGRVGSVQDFSQTSIDLVLSRMKFKENCVVVPGVFPDSAAVARRVHLPLFRWIVISIGRFTKDSSISTPGCLLVGIYSFTTTTTTPIAALSRPCASSRRNRESPTFRFRTQAAPPCFRSREEDRLQGCKRPKAARSCAIASRASVRLGSSRRASVRCATASWYCPR